MTKNVNHVQSNDFLENVEKEKKELEESMKESFRQRDERKMKEPYTIIHTKEFSCEDDHPLVYYVVNEKGEGMCEYCAKRFKYEEKKDDKNWANDVLRGSG